jgi:hypothetical protein
VLEYVIAWFAPEILATVYSESGFPGRRLCEGLASGRARRAVIT